MVYGILYLPLVSQDVVLPQEKIKPYDLSIQWRVSHCHVTAAPSVG